MRVTNKTNFKAVERKVRAAIGLYADTAAKKMEGEAKKMLLGLTVQQTVEIPYKVISDGKEIKQ